MAALVVAGCNGPFFTCEGKASCSTTGTGTGTGGGTTPANTGDFAYVANSSAGTTDVSEYSIANGTLSPLGTASLGYIPVALAVAPSNSFLYAASTPGFTTPGIYLYSIGSTGTLSVANGGNAVAFDTVAAMAISPDGKWLYTVNVDGQTMAQYSVDASTGLLTQAGVVTLPGTPCTLTTAVPVSQSCSVTVAPGGGYVVASLGLSGNWVYPFTSAGGISQVGLLTVSSYSTANPVGNFSTAVDANNYMYVAQTSSVSVYAIGATALTDEGTVSDASGTAPRSITLGKGYSYLYTANEAAGSISGYGISGSGTLNEIAGAPFAAPASVSALAIDNTGGYMVAVGYDGNAGVELYSISATTGALTKVAASGSGSSTLYPALVAMTH